jgi:LuxR family transcriptional regulator, positive regulator of biofilm formation
MNIVVHLSNHLISEALHQLLVGSGYANVVTDANTLTNGATPHVFLVDVTTLNHDFLTRYPDAKVLLIDTGMEPEEIIAILLAYKIQGVLSPRTELHLFKKALKVVSDGQVWIDDGKVKSSLDDAGVISDMGKISGITGREKQIIGHVCQGLTNKEIAQVLALSEATVRTHLVNIFRKLSITKRSKLMTLALNRQQALSA